MELLFDNVDYEKLFGTYDKLFVTDRRREAYVVVYEGDYVEIRDEVVGAVRNLLIDFSLSPIMGRGFYYNLLSSILFLTLYSLMYFIKASCSLDRILTALSSSKLTSNKV